MKSREQIHQPLSLATFTAFFRLSLDETATTSYFYIELITRLLFEVSLPMSLAVQGSKHFPIMIFRAIRTLWTHEASFLVQQVSSYIMAIPIIANFLFMAYMIHFYRTRRSNAKVNPTLGKAMQLHILWACGPLYIPYISIPLNYISCDDVGQSCSYFKVGPAEVVFFLLLVVIHTTFCMVYSVSVFHWSPLSNYCGAQAHSRVNIEATVFKAIVSIVFELIIKIATPMDNYALVIFCSCYHLYIAISFWYDMPYLDIKMNKLLIGVYIVSFMGSISVFTRMLITDPEDIMSLSMFIIGSVLIVSSISIMTDFRFNKIKSKPIHGLETAADIDIRIRTMLKDLFSLTQQESQEVDPDNTLKNKIKKDIDAILSFHADNYKGSFKVNLVWATYVFLVNGNKFLAMRKLRKIIESSPFIFDILPVQIRIRYFSQSSSSEEAALVSYEEQHRLERYAVDCMTRCLSCHLSFWGTLISEKYEIQALEDIGAKISFLTEEAQESLNRMIVLSSRNAIFRRLYAQFLEIFVNDDEGAQKQIRLAAELEKEGKEDDPLTSAANCIMVMSGEKETLGQILEVNRKTCDTFGLLREEIIGKKMNILMPSIFANSHNTSITSYIENKNTPSSSFVKSGVIFKYTNGFVGEGIVRVREYSNFTLVPSITFFGSLAIKKARIFCIIRIQDFVVVELSHSFFTAYNPDVKLLSSMRYKISDAVDQFNDEAEKMREVLKTENAYVFQCYQCSAKASKRVSIHVARLLYTSSSEYYHVVIHGLYDNKEHLRTETNIHTMDFLDCKKPPPVKKRFSSKERDTTISSVMSVEEENSSFYNKFASRKTFDHRRANQTSSKNLSFKDIPASNSFRVESMISKSKIMQESSNNMPIDHYHKRNTTLQRITSSEEVIDEEKMENKNIKVPTSTSRSNGFAIRRSFLLPVSQTNEMYQRLYYWILLLVLVLSFLIMLLQQLAIKAVTVSSSQVVDILCIPVENALAYGAFVPELTRLYDQNPYFQEDDLDETRRTENLDLFYQDLKQLEELLYTLRIQSGIFASPLFMDEAVILTTWDEMSINITLDKAVLVFASMMGIASRTPLQEVNQTVAFEFLSSGNVNSLLQGWKSFRTLMLVKGDTQNSLLNAFHTIITITAGIIGVFIFFTRILPILVTHLKSKNKVYHFFQAIDHGSLREICTRSVTHIALFEQYGNMEIETLNEAEDLIEVLDSKWSTFNTKIKKIVARSKVQSRLKGILTYKYTWLLFLIEVIGVVYFIGSRYWWTVQNEALINSIEQRLILEDDQRYNVQQLAASILNWDESKGWFGLNMTTIKNWEETIRDLDNTIYYGGQNVTNVVDTQSIVDSYMLLDSNVCTLLSENNLIQRNRTSCETFMKGILNFNPHDLTLALIRVSEDLRLLYSTMTNLTMKNGKVANDSSVANFAENVIEFSELTGYWYPLLLQYQVIWLRNAFNNTISAITTIRNVSGIVTLIIYFLLSIFVYRPMVKRMRFELRDTRNLLNIIPNEMMHRTSQSSEFSEVVYLNSTTEVLK